MRGRKVTKARKKYFTHAPQRSVELVSVLTDIRVRDTHPHLQQQPQQQQQHNNKQP